MTKHDLILEVVRRYPRFSWQEVKTMVDTLFAGMAQALARGERIELRGFGSFSVKHRLARQGRNPQTGAVVAVAAKRVPFFKVANELRLRVDGQTLPVRRREPT